MVRVRFAPSPTGYIHIGNARTALFNYLFAQKQGGSYILRIEDTDAERSKDEYIHALYEDLAWLGIEWQEGPDIGGPFGPYRQTERIETYRDMAAKLLKEGKAYRCYCTEEELEAHRREAEMKRIPPRYSNRCRTLSSEEREKRIRRGVRPVLRFRIDDPELTLVDLIRGTVEFNLDQMVGDFVIMKQDNTPTFHLAVCADDGLMKITHVIRGEDHLPNTPRHILLFRALGFEPPKFAHMSLTASPTGGLLSKREGATSIREYRELGYPESGVVNYLSLLGWSSSDTHEIFTMDELKERFDLAHMRKSAAIFDRAKLEWVCGMHLRRMTDRAFVEQAFQYISAHQILPPGCMEKEGEWYEQAVLLFKDNIHSYSDLKNRLSVFEEPLRFEEDDAMKSEEVQRLLEAAAKSLESLPDVPADFWPEWTAKLKMMTKLKGKDLFIPLRHALTGCREGPELRRLVQLLGRERCLNRLRQARKTVTS
ncbi:MAG: glutamate--tRNA ligase [Candidatus Omnitrophica bacterium]|nr:glutamate--tRNA ligase [Candidatus Omnitrophota bacterium]